MVNSDDQFLAAQDEETSFVSSLSFYRGISGLCSVGEAAAYEGYFPASAATERFGGGTIAMFLK